MARDPELKAHRAVIDAAYDRAVDHVARKGDLGVDRVRRAVSLEGRRLMSRAHAKVVVLEHLRDGATGRADLLTLSSSTDPLIIAAAVGATLSEDPEAVSEIIGASEEARAALGPWLSGNALSKAA